MRESLSKSQKIVACGLLVVGLLLAGFVSLRSNSTVNAQASQGASCSTKINVKNCQKAVEKECGKYKKGGSKYTSCANSTISRFKNDPRTEVDKAAVKACGDGALGSKEAACRNGYGHGYRGNETLLVACVTRDTSTYKYSKAEQESCKVGFAKGARDGGGGDSSGGKLGQSGKYICGTYPNEDRNVHTKFDFGCLGTAYAKDPSGFPSGSKNLSPILDFVYAIIRFLSIGVGIVITLALIASGIQYSASEGSAEASTKAKKRIESALTGLVIYIFTWSILQFLIPGGVFR